MSQSRRERTEPAASGLPRIRSVEARRPDGAIDVLRVGWDRAWAFTPVKVLQRNTSARRVAARSWTWQWVLVALMAVWMAPFHWLTVARQAGEVWMVDGASARVRPLRVDRERRRPGAAVVLAVVFVLVVVLMLGPVGVVAGGLAGGVGVVPGWLAAVGSVWLVGVIVLSALMSWQPRQSRMAQLLDRIRELAAVDGVGYVLSEVAASRAGSGAGGALLTVLQTRWAHDGAVGVLWAASDDLVGYYRRWGWTVDPEGDGRRMLWSSGAAGAGQRASCHGE